MNQDDKRFVMNEYVDVDVKRDMLQICSDCYRAFGWTVINTKTGMDTMTLQLQRERKIKNRVALCDLQRKCEEALISIEKLETSKTKKAMIVSMSVGIIGTICMAGATFAYLHNLIPLTVLLAIPGFAGWIFPYFLYQKCRKETELSVKPMIEQNYDTIYELCERAAKLRE